MFDIGASELLLTVIVAVVVIGPKDLPLALRTAGRWIGKLRRMSGHFRAGLDAMIREAEMAEMEKEWKERNAQIMASDPHPMEPLPDAPAAASAEARAKLIEAPKEPEEPQLPLGGAPPPP